MDNGAGGWDGRMSGGPLAGLEVEKRAWVPRLKGRVMNLVTYELPTGAALLSSTASRLVLALLAATLPSAAMAQDATEPAGAPNISAETSTTPDPNNADEQDTADEIIVTGTRRALQTSQNIKRDADTAVDSITATDIGAFPDKSVAEALQRVPGITVNRFSASDDISHFSAEPSGVIVRGLNQVRTEINGRDSFSANSSRGLGFADISPELMAGVDVYKNITAEMIEGGIAGTINLRTRVPFDAPGELFQATINANYNDKRGQVTPEVSATYSNRWSTGIGDLGLLLNGAFSQVKSRSEGTTYGRMGVFDNVYGPGTQYIPSSVGYRETDYDRIRRGLAAAAQWRSSSGKLLATGQYNRSEYEEQWRERGIITYITDLFAFPADFSFTRTGPFNSRIPRSAPGTPAFTFDGDGNFETGVLNNQQTDFSWWGGAEGPNGTGQFGAEIAVNDQGRSMFSPCYSWGNAEGPPGACGEDSRGPDFNAVTRFNDSRRVTQDAALNLKWEASDRLNINLDGQYVHSTVENYDIEVGQYSYANVALDATGRRPTFSFSAPYNINQSAGGLSNPNNYRYNHAMDHVEDDKGTEFALRADAEYDLQGDWLSSLRVGARYADRDQDVRFSAYNWANISNSWNMDNGQAAYWNIDRTAPAASGPFKGYPVGLIDVRSLNGSDYVFFDMFQLENRGANNLSFDSLGIGQDQWQPICSNGGLAKTGPRTAEIAGTCFRPDELNRVSEATKSAYAMLKFGGPDARIGGLTVRGNIGVRYVETKVKVAGSTVFPNAFNASGSPCVRNVAAAGQPAPTTPYSIGCYLFGNADLLRTTPPPAGFTDIALSGSPNVVNFNNGGSLTEDVTTTHKNWLPSLNLRVDLSPQWLVRFAVSRALSRPDIGLLRNYTTFGTQLPSNDPNDPRFVRNAAGQIIGVTASYNASGYNPRLKPITATQFDLSLENYFANVGSFAIAGFYKKFSDYIQYGSELREFVNNGVTNTIEVRGPQNGKGGSIYGAEASFQRFFDFLPGALSGFGIQANATYIKNEGIENSGLKNQSGTEGGGQAQPGTGGTTLSVSGLEGLSKYAFNLVGMYEKYGLAVRVAYNWRSKFLVSAVDCCTYLPTYQEAAGYLDASIRYAITPNIELSVQGSNLLDTESRILQQVTSAEEGALLKPAAWFRNDRRFVAGARFKF